MKKESLVGAVRCQVPIVIEELKITDSILSEGIFHELNIIYSNMDPASILIY